MEANTIIGLIAGFCTTVAFLPQVIKTWKPNRLKTCLLECTPYFVPVLFYGSPTEYLFPICQLF